ncbi:hypothetical protein [Sporosarcina sp. SAFN-015]|uniref:hypothetical protein n=1 Tax=Sporosarcina sp. SAFN-015 TaxID=3387274 RepID=UPI003F819D14
MMIKDILRGAGIGCIIAGGIIYFTSTDIEQADPEKYKIQLDELQAELDKVKQELAVAQTLSSPKSGSTDSQDSNNGKEKTESNPNGETNSKPITKVILTIEAGSTSKSVAHNLEQAGIIDNAKELEQYLINNGLAGRIQIGVHEVDTTMDLDMIARIITNTK